MDAAAQLELAVSTLLNQVIATKVSDTKEAHNNLVEAEKAALAAQRAFNALDFEAEDAMWWGFNPESPKVRPEIIE